MYIICTYVIYIFKDSIMSGMWIHENNKQKANYRCSQS